MLSCQEEEAPGSPCAGKVEGGPQGDMVLSHRDVPTLSAISCNVCPMTKLNCHVHELFFKTKGHRKP